jgi:hypothetical protein
VISCLPRIVSSPIFPNARWDHGGDDEGIRLHPGHSTRHLRALPAYASPSYKPVHPPRNEGSPR